MRATNLPPNQPNPNARTQTKDATHGGKSAARMNKGKIMRKLLGQPAPTPNENIEHTISDLPKLRPSASQGTSYYAGAPIACLDRSPDGQRAVIAGSKIFKIINVVGSTVKEETDLRAGITSYATTHNLSAATPDQLNIRAVKWSHGFLDSTVITACGNGRIAVYDINRGGEGYEVARIQEHARQVHKLAISPFKCNWLLSASQDGTVRSFDLRTPLAGRHGPTFRTWQTFKCNADAVRDVKWSPTDGMEFACCTDSGSVQKWDIRKGTAPVLKLPAHQTSCSSISWHPDGEHLVSGGADQYCHVWDLSKKADRNQKPRYTFATPAPVSSVSWRPACWSTTAQGHRAAQVTVAYDDSSATKTQNSTVHLWDLARPSMPFKEIEQWDTSPSALLWSSRDLLWSVDREGHFTQTDVAFMPKVIDRRSLSTFAFSPAGDVIMMLEERQVPRRRSRPTITPSEVSPGFQGGSGPFLSVSRSDSDEDVVGSFLGSRKRKTLRRRNSGRSNPSFSSTPPSMNSIADKVMSLDDAVKVTGIYKSQQVMAIGHAPGTSKRVTYQYFTNRYLLRLDKYLRQDTSPDVRIVDITDSFARTAESVGHYRQAQTWRLLGYNVNLLLVKRAEYHRQCRLRVPETSATNEKASEQPAELKSRGHETPRRKRRGWETPRKKSRAPSPAATPPRHHSAITIIPDDVESTSNVATPLVRPVRDQIISQTREAMHTPINVDDDVLNLSGTMIPLTPSPIPVPGAAQNKTNDSPSIDGYDFYGVDSVSPVVDFHAPQRKPPLRLDYPAQCDSQPIIHPLQRHDSGESFQMFSTSSESQQTKFLSSSTSDKGHSQGLSLRDRVSTWENSLSSQPRRRLDSETLTDVTDTTDSGSVIHTKPSSGAANAEVQDGIPYDPAIPPVFNLQEPSLQSATQTIEFKKPTEVLTTSSTVTEKPPADPNIIESDFLPQPNDPEFASTPLDPKTLVQNSIEFECQSGSLTAAVMVLLFVPLLPNDAIDPIWANGIMRQYHHRLMQMQLFTEAALLRNLCVPLYPSVFAMAQENVRVGFFCTTCEKPLENDPLIPNSQWFCPRCSGPIDGCAVCKSRELQNHNGYPGEEDEGAVNLKLWWYCPGCGHGGHTLCMQAWHGPSILAHSKYAENTEKESTNSGGCCPLTGCMHPCLPGSWRTEFMNEKKVLKEREMTAAVSSRLPPLGRGAALGRGPVRRDNREVEQSRAVEGVRVALLPGEGRLEKKKSVKVVAPGDDGA